MSGDFDPNWSKHKRSKHDVQPPTAGNDHNPKPGVTFLSDLLKGIDQRRQTAHTDNDLPAPFSVPKSYVHVPHEYLASDGFPRSEYWVHPICKLAVPSVGEKGGKGGLKQQALDFYRAEGIDGVPDPLPKIMKTKDSPKPRHPKRSQNLRAARETDQSAENLDRLSGRHDAQLTRFDDPILPFEDLERTMEIIFNCYRVVTHGRGQFVDRDSERLVLTYEYMDLEAMAPEARREHQADVDTMLMATKLFKRLPTPKAASLPGNLPITSGSNKRSYPTMSSNTLNFRRREPEARESSPLTSLPPSSRESSPLTSLPPSDAEEHEKSRKVRKKIVEPKPGITTNGALIHGRMYCFGQTVGFASDILLSPYMPIKGSSRSLYECFLSNLPAFGARIGSRFKKFCDEGFLVARKLMNDLRVPSFASTSKFQPSGPLDFSANLAFTLGNFYNKPHTDNDQGKVYCLWYPVDCISGKIVTWKEGFFLEGGWFVFPEFRTAFNLGGKYGVQIAWDGKNTFHHTLPSRERVVVGKDGKKVHYTRLGCSTQITHTMARAGARIGTDEQWNRRKNCDRKIRDCEDVKGLGDRDWKE